MPQPLHKGLYDELIDGRLRRLLDRLDPAYLADTGAVDEADLPDRVSRLVADVFRAGLASTRDPTERADLVRAIRATLEHAIPQLLREGELDLGRTTASAERLLEIRPAQAGLAATSATRRPITPLADSTLLMNAPGEPSLAQELQAELASADEVALLIAFVKWSGFRLIEDALRDVVARGGRVRVLTTTYTGASDLRALAALARTGSQVRISFDNRRTRLHAKSWVFHRRSGATTAYIGSSNLSSAALVDGLEWNVRLSALESPTLIEKISAAFETHWESEEFESFDPQDEGQMAVVRQALQAARFGSDATAPLTFFDLRPHGYQQSILDGLQSERERGHSHNLVVAPTGVGKTMVAAFDYHRLTSERGLGRPTLLFVAHRERLLDQSLDTFRHVLKDSVFGEKLVGGHEPERGDHVFASIQSLNSGGRIDGLAPDHYKVVIVDEFHHAEAPTYERLLTHLRPRVLLGLTATPERHDGKDVRRWFDGRLAYEMRLWHALDLGLLAPFHYFGIHDQVDLRHVSFSHGKYDEAELTQIYTGNDARVRLILDEISRVVGDPAAMRALGFCVSVQHARFMADRFSRAGIPSASVTGDAGRDERDRAIRDLEKGDLKVLFTVDLFNEGVDIPSVDTVLFLRPTESATLFLQQLGRGLRLHPDKPCLTVLDFIGNAHVKFRFDLRYRALLGGTAKQIRHMVEEDFPFLPPGCAMRLDRVARDVVLGNLRAVTTQGTAWLAGELQALGPATSLRRFLDETDVELVELYDGKSRSFTSLKDRVFGVPGMDAERRKRLARIARLIHTNDDERLSAYRRLLEGEPANTPAELRLSHMLVSAFLDRRPVSEFRTELTSLLEDDLLREELIELLPVLEDQPRGTARSWPNDMDAPLAVHGRYRREEVLAGLDIRRNGKIPTVQAGVFHDPDCNADLLFVTLNKTADGFSPKTMYRDYAISPSRFHWESQHTAHQDSEAGRRYLARSSQVLLFVREHQELPNGLAEPFVFLGPAGLRDAQGERPMQIEWDLEYQMPDWLYRKAAVLAR